MAVVLFDGVCNLCNAVVRFVIERDPAGRFQFASLESEAARRTLAGAGASRGLPESLMVVDETRLYTRSDAVLRIARDLRFPWPVVGVLTLVPRGVRDRVYDLVARHRYRWFGRQDVCPLPTPATRARFLE